MLVYTEPVAPSSDLPAACDRYLAEIIHSPNFPCAS